MFKQNDTVVINNSKISKLLNNSSAAKNLQPFFLTPRTLTQAAKLTGKKPASYYYWIKKFINMGLLKVAYEEKRAGSNIKYYSTIAKNIIIKDDKHLNIIRDYFVNAVEEYNHFFAISYVESLFDLDKMLGLMFTSSEEGYLHTTLVSITDDGKGIPVGKQFEKMLQPATHVSWHHLQLRFQDAKELQGKLRKLAKEYEKKCVENESSYLMQLGLIPVKAH